MTSSPHETEGSKRWNQSTSMDHATVFTELALAALRANTQFALIPVAVRPRTGASRFGTNWRANRRIIAALVTAVRTDLLEPRE